MKNLVKKYKWLIIVVSGIVLIGIPMIVQYGIIGNNVSSKGSNDGWLSFIGSYLGGVIGGVIAGCITLYVLIKTLESNETSLRESKRQYEDSKALQVMPYLVLKYMPKKDNFDLESMYIERNMQCIEEDVVAGDFELSIENIGLGVAVGFIIKHVYAYGKQLHKRAEAINFNQYNLAQGEKMSLHLACKFCCERNFSIEEEEIFLEAHYQDLLGNEYRQKFNLHVLFGIGELMEIKESSPELV